MNKLILQEFCLSKITTEDYAKQQGYSVGTIKNWLRKYNLTKRQTNYLKENDIQEINKLYANEYSIRDIRTIMGYSIKTILKYLIKPRTKSESKSTFKYRAKSKSGLNHYVFDKITNESAYALGLIVTDGSVDKTGYRVSYHSKDDELIQIMRKIFTLNGSSFTSKAGTQLRFNSKYMVDTLKNYGVYPNKTFTVKMPILSNSFYSHFFRGVFDGDGTIAMNKGSLDIRITSGSKDFLSGIQKYLFQKLNIKTSISSAGKKCYLLRISGKKNAIPFCKYIYKNSTGLRLNRKYIRFENAYSK